VAWSARLGRSIILVLQLVHPMSHTPLSPPIIISVNDITRGLDSNRYLPLPACFYRSQERLFA